MKDRWTNENIGDLSGIITVVTGANSGIGFETAKELAGHGSTVIMACRNLEKAASAKALILKDYPDAKLDIMQLDLADLESIKNFCHGFSNLYPCLHLLINNAGVLNIPNEKTKQGLQSIMGTNFFGPFALTAGLYPLLINADGNARIVTVGSDTHRFGKIDFDNFNGEKPYKNAKEMLHNYAASKLAGMMFAFRLDRLFKENNIPILSVAAHPGVCVMQSSHANKEEKFNKLFTFGLFISNHTFALSDADGAKAVLRAATERNLSGGEYYSPQSMIFKEMRGEIKLTKASEQAYDDDIAKRLWKCAEELTDIKFEISPQPQQIYQMPVINRR